MTTTTTTMFFYNYFTDVANIDKLGFEVESIHDGTVMVSNLYKTYGYINFHINSNSSQSLKGKIVIFNNVSLCDLVNKISTIPECNTHKSSYMLAQHIAFTNTGTKQTYNVYIIY